MFSSKEGEESEEENCIDGEWKKTMKMTKIRTKRSGRRRRRR